jgi:SAM-dependent methyltransferase
MASSNDSPRPEQRQGEPSLLDIIRLSRAPVFPPGGEDLYRQIGVLTEMGDGTEVLDVACGRGVSTSSFVRSFGVHAAGVDPDEALIRSAEGRARDAGLEASLHFQHGQLDDLPYKDGTFDVTVGELGVSAATDPAAAVAELARVTRAGGQVVLVQLIWTRDVPPERQEALFWRLGARPMMMVEWKQLLRDAGVVDLHVEDWSRAADTFSPLTGAGISDFAEIFTMREKFAIVRRALQRWGWRGVRSAIEREHEVNRLLTRERVLGLIMVRGTRWNGGEHTAQGGGDSASASVDPGSATGDPSTLSAADRQAGPES